MKYGLNCDIHVFVDVDRELDNRFLRYVFLWDASSPSIRLLNIVVKARLSIFRNVLISEFDYGIIDSLGNS